MILPSSTGSTVPPVACSSSPNMINATATSIANQIMRKPKHNITQQQTPSSCMSTMDNYNPFSTIINQVEKKNLLFLFSF